MKRVQVTEEELAILEGLRHERAIWNQALEAVMALKEIQELPESYEVLQKLMELRK